MESISWKEIRAEVTQVNSTLASLIDDLAIDSSFGLYDLSYDFGANLIEDSIFLIPKKQDKKYKRCLIPITSNQIPTKISDDLAYNDFNHPVYLILSGSTEIFFDDNGRITPFGIAKPGSLIGLWKALDSEAKTPLCLNLSNWGVTSGARSTFLLSKISETRAHSRLVATFGLTSEKPGSLDDHWKVFKDISHSIEPEKRWKTRIICFGKKWFEQKNNVKWQAFNQHLLSVAWNGSSYWRNRFTWDMAFSFINQKLEIKPRQYHVDIVRTLIELSLGAIPGFRPAITEEHCPLSLIKMAYKDVYKISQNPVVMTPEYINGKPIYFSIQKNSAISLAVKPVDKSSSLEDLYISHALLKKYIHCLSSKKEKILTTPLDHLNKFKFELFHSDPGQYQEFIGINKLFESDSAFSKNSHTENPESSLFFKGCIKISKEE